MKKSILKNLLRSLLIPVGLSFLSACANKREEMQVAWYAGDNVKAQTKALEILDNKKEGTDALINMFEAASTSRGAGDFKKSKELLKDAYTLVKQYDEEAEVSISKETLAVLINQTMLPYRGYYYDRIMMSAYQALNYMQLGETENAKRELRRLYSFQKDAQYENQKRIEKEKEKLDAELAKNKSGFSITDTISNNEKLGTELTTHYGSSYQKNAHSAAKLFSNAFAYWLNGIYLAANAHDSAELESARKFLEFANGATDAKNPFIAIDLMTIEKNAPEAKKTNGVTYVIYEAGSAPIRKSFRVELPLMLINSKLPHVSMNFPYLKMQDSYVANIRVQAGSQSFYTECIADMDAIIKNEFDINLPMVITKTILGAAIKAGASAAVQNSIGDDSTRLVAGIGLGLLQASINNADLRTWSTLPKQISIARVETPANGSVTVDGFPLELNPKTVNIVHVKNNSASASSVIKVFNISK